ITLITHSGTVFDAMSQNNRDVHFNYVISSGNETALTVADYLRFVIHDPTTRVVACYLETVRDPAGFIAALELAAERQIPVVALKVGLSERGQKMAQAHTGALAGGAEAHAALFRRYGVLQVRSLDEMMDTVELLSRVQQLPGRQMSVLMESGGERSLLADHASELDLSFAELTPATNQRLAEILEPGVVPDNPLDAFGTGHDVVGTYRESLLALHDDPHTDLLVLAVDLARDSYLSQDYVEAALSACDQLSKPFVGLVNLTSGANEGLVARLRANGIPMLMGTETGLRAIRHLIAFNEFTSRPTATSEFLGRPAPDVVADLREQLQQVNGPLDEHAAKAMLAVYGLTVTKEAVVHSAAEAVAAANRIGYPVVLKTAVSTILHKSDVGGIHLYLADAQAVQEAYRSLAGRLGTAVLVQEMVSGGVEMILGMTHDPQFGPIVLVGMGGVFVEIYQDVLTVLPPLSRFTVEQLPRQLRGKALLEGVRGGTAVDHLALTETILRFSTFVTDLGDLLAEVDINPLKLHPSGAIIVDALIIPQQQDGKQD
ncbi:MAG: acetate--CoA ligase family protein, partial [Anaerolineae bacterium]